MKHQRVLAAVVWSLAYGCSRGYSTSPPPPEPSAAPGQIASTILPGTDSSATVAMQGWQQQQGDETRAEVSQRYGTSQTFEVTVAAAQLPGFSATGVLIGIPGNILKLDTNPCGSKKIVQTFRQPYARRSISPVTCPNGQFPQEQVVQQ